jgi:hypothetical protein
MRVEASEVGAPGSIAMVREGNSPQPRSSNKRRCVTHIRSCSLAAFVIGIVAAISPACAVNFRTIKLADTVNQGAVHKLRVPIDYGFSVLPMDGSPRGWTTVEYLSAYDQDTWDSLYWLGGKYWLDLHPAEIIDATIYYRTTKSKERNDAWARMVAGVRKDQNWVSERVDDFERVGPKDNRNGFYLSELTDALGLPIRIDCGEYCETYYNAAPGLYVEVRWFAPFSGLPSTDKRPCVDVKDWKQMLARVTAHIGALEQK